ncbi:MAG: 30S ribosomal protein S6 [Deltaproteobacteria bacterium]|nr:30S ribosomal protein S6 [Deltaproteobacteria bacterium]
MRRYESVWVVHGDLPDEEVKSTIDKFTRIISSQGGLLVGVEDWGRRKLAYKIQGTLRGSYVCVDFAGQPGTVKELERNYRIDDRVIRYLTFRKAEEVDLEALQAEITRRAQAAAAREAASAPEAPSPPSEAAPMPAAAPTETPAAAEASGPAPAEEV